MAEHMQLATEEGQEMLLEEIPESPSAKPRHWYLAGAGLALLVVLGVAAKVVYRSPETLLQSKNFDINTVQEWEQIPGIDQVVGARQDLGIEAARCEISTTSSTNLSRRSFLGSAPSASLMWFRELLTWARLWSSFTRPSNMMEFDAQDNSPAGCAASIAGFHHLSDLDCLLPVLRSKCMRCSGELWCPLCWRLDCFDGQLR